MIVEKVSNGIAPLTSLPLIKKVGVDVTPSSVASPYPPAPSFSAPDSDGLDRIAPDPFRAPARTAANRHPRAAFDWRTTCRGTPRTYPGSWLLQPPHISPCGGRILSRFIARACVRLRLVTPQERDDVSDFLRAQPELRRAHHQRSWQPAAVGDAVQRYDLRHPAHAAHH